GRTGGACPVRDRSVGWNESGAGVALDEEPGHRAGGFRLKGRLLGVRPSAGEAHENNRRQDADDGDDDQEFDEREALECSILLHMLTSFSFCFYVLLPQMNCR